MRTKDARFGLMQGWTACMEAVRRRLTVSDRPAPQCLKEDIALPLRQRTVHAEAALRRAAVHGEVAQRRTVGDRAVPQWLTAVSGEAAQGRIAHIAFFRRRGMACAKAV